MKKYFKVWWIFAKGSLQSQLVMRWGLVLLFLGKILRFSIFTFFIVLLLEKTSALAGYNLEQTILFYLTFNLIDMSGQLVYREVYRFRAAVVNGSFDYYLIRPYNSLFRALTSGPDLLDFITFIPLVGAIAFFLSRLQNIDALDVGLYILLVIAGFIIATGFHILVLSLGVQTTEIDHAMMVYRDFTGMARFPIDIYREPIRGILTFILPVGLMITFPVKALLGLLSPIYIGLTVLFAVGFLFFTIKVWKWSVNKYSSAGG